MPPEGEKKRILITGFKPFEDSINITELIVKRLKLDPNLYEVNYLVLPVTEDNQAEILIFKTEAERFKPDFIISLGEMNVTRLDDYEFEKKPEDTEVLRYEESITTPTDEELYTAYNSETFFKSLEAYLKQNGSYIHMTKNIAKDPCGKINLEVARYMASRGEEYKNNFMFLHLEDTLGEPYIKKQVTENLEKNGKYQKLSKDLEEARKKRFQYEEKFYNDQLHGDRVPLQTEEHKKLNEEFNTINAKVTAIEEATKQKIAEKIKEKSGSDEYSNLIEKYKKIVEFIMPEVSAEIDRDRLAQAKIPPVSNQPPQNKNGNRNR